MPRRTDYQEVFNQQRTAERTRHYGVIRKIDESEARLNSTIRKFEEYPLQILDINDINYFNNFDIDLSKILDNVCREHHWVHVDITKTRYDEWVMKLPVNPKTEKLVSSLLLVAKPDASRYSDDILRVDSLPRSWTFVFWREKGQQMLNGWIEYARTDPMARLYLGFFPPTED